MALSNLDRELLRDCIAQQPKAWENFCDRFIGLVLHVVHHTANTMNMRLTNEARDDLVADVYLSWLEKDFAILRRFRGESSLATYLAVVARRVILRRLAQLRLPNNDRSLNDLENEVAAPETNRFTREDVEHIQASIDMLSPNEAAAVRMFHLEGKSYREISSHIGMPENSVGPFLTRARDKMRRTV